MVYQVAEPDGLAADPDPVLPFVTQGATPIHVYDEVAIEECGDQICFLPSGEIRNYQNQIALGAYGADRQVHHHHPVRRADQRRRLHLRQHPPGLWRREAELHEGQRGQGADDQQRGVPGHRRQHRLPLRLGLQRGAVSALSGAEDTFTTTISSRRFTASAASSRTTRARHSTPATTTSGARHPAQRHRGEDREQGQLRRSCGRGKPTRMAGISPTTSRRPASRRCTMSTPHTNHDGVFSEAPMEVLLGGSTKYWQVDFIGSYGYPEPRPVGAEWRWSRRGQRPPVLR